jgi:hypothetical protein
VWVTTDIHGNGCFTVVVGPIASGTYDVEFDARDGAGCNLTGGASNGSDCASDFQLPGPSAWRPRLPDLEQQRAMYASSWN